MVGDSKAALANALTTLKDSNTKTKLVTKTVGNELKVVTKDNTEESRQALKDAAKVEPLYDYILLLPNLN